ncbi:MAG: flavodoxin family protein [Proteobacteria bacterium]|nr:flavodoxin family protein [Pseudomonadota bacterium]MBU1688626.1 flavodoxin family protein [Pseudomonadota bacterium]
MADVLIFQGSPRKKGNTETLIEAVIDGIASGGGTSELIRLAELNIHPCIGCGGCDKKGRCVVKDDMTPLYEKIMAARRVILASPIYFYSITAQAKAFVDRCQALWSLKHIKKAEGIWRDDPDRKGYLVSVAATRGERVFEGAVLVMKYACDAMGIGYGGDLLVKGVDRRGEMANNAGELTRGKEFGRYCVELTLESRP